MRWPHLAFLFAAIITGGVIGFVVGMRVADRSTARTMKETTDLIQSSDSLMDLQYTMLLADKLEEPNDKAIHELRELVADNLEFLLDQAASEPNWNSMTSDSDIQNAKEALRRLENQIAEQGGGGSTPISGRVGSGSSDADDLD